MATLGIEAPVAQAAAGSVGIVPLRAFTTSSHVKESDIVVLTAGTIATATANVAGGIAGIATHDSSANFGGEAAPYVQATDLPFALGASQVGTPLFPPDSGQTLVALLDPPLQAQINLTNITGWITGGTYQANIGTAVGLNIDTGAGTQGTGYFVADPNASNKVGTIIDVVTGPAFGIGFNAEYGPPSGTIAARVIVQFYPAALAI